MLEGKEKEGMIGSDGSYYVDVDQYGMIRAEAAYGRDGVKGGAFVEMNIMDILKMLALKSENQIDDAAIAFIGGLLPSKPAEPAA